MRKQTGESHGVQGVPVMQPIGEPFSETRTGTTALPAVQSLLLCRPGSRHESVTSPRRDAILQILTMPPGSSDCGNRLLMTSTCQQRKVTGSELKSRVPSRCLSHVHVSANATAATNELTRLVLYPSSKSTGDARAPDAVDFKAQ